MQLLAQHSDEGDAAGLGWIAAKVVRFSVRDTLRYKVPQIGWNTMAPRKESRLVQGIPRDSEFYFVHSFHLVCENPDDILGETVYDYPFVSAVARGNIYGVQFHPEKSQDAGETLLRNFVTL
jgi:glutamine amidotransferase